MRWNSSTLQSCPTSKYSPSRSIMAAPSPPTQHAQYFPRFTNLPTEIRLLIWHHCLPGGRVLEVDYPVDSSQLRPVHRHWNGHITHAGCCAAQFAVTDTAPPVISRTCHESRQVALEYGHALQYAEMYGVLETSGTPRSLWVQPNVDTLHLNWCADKPFERAEKVKNTHIDILCFISTAARNHLLPSVMAHFVHPFKEMEEITKAPNLSINVGFEWLTGFVQWSAWCRRYQVVVGSVILHIHTDGSSLGGLFGSSGDEPVQIALANDEAKIKAFEQLWTSTRPNSQENPETRAFFEYILSSKFQEHVSIWKDEADFAVLARRLWCDAKYADVNDPESIWTMPVQRSPPYGDWELFKNHLNLDHEWVKKVLAERPLLIPVVMFRHCSRGCDMNESQIH